MTDATASSPDPAPAPHVLSGSSGWQPLPARAARLAALGSGIAALVPFVVFGVVNHLGADTDRRILAAILALAVAIPLLAAWLSWRRTRRTQWCLDDNALGMRRQHLWQSEVRVPRARVQHLDIQRGPLQRRAGLATLTVHTAGSRHHALRLAGLDLADAQRLRELLARPQDHDGL